MAKSIIKDLQSPKTVTHSITKTAGASIVSGSTATFFKKSGKTVAVRISLNGQEIEGGGGTNIFEGTLNTQELIPAAQAGLVGYFGTRALVGFIYTNGNIIIRNASTEALTPSSLNVVLVGSYLTE